MECVIRIAKVCHPDRSGGISASWQQTRRLALSGVAGKRSFGFAQDDKLWGGIRTAKPVIPTAKICHPDRSGGISAS